MQYTGPTGVVNGREFCVSARHLPVYAAAAPQVDRVIALLYSS